MGNTRGNWKYDVRNDVNLIQFSNNFQYVECCNIAVGIEIICLGRVSYPPIKGSLPSSWKYLPYLAIPDGAHRSEQGKIVAALLDYPKALNIIQSQFCIQVLSPLLFYRKVRMTMLQCLENGSCLL